MTKFIEKGIACNLIYNNGDQGDFVGFKGLCTIENIKFNINKGTGRWCSQESCKCKKYSNNGFKDKSRPKDYPCNESRVFVNYKWNPGNRFADETPFIINRSKDLKIAVLTTVFGNNTERDRKVVGFLFVDSIEEKHQINGNKSKSVRLPMEIADKLNFWAYYKNKDMTPKWSQGRFRYLTEDRLAVIFHDLLVVLKDDNQKRIVQDILNTEFSNFATQRPQIESALPNNTVNDILNERKYGKGGESEAHKKLKEYIAKNPKLLGLKKSDYNAILEHTFLSADRVDILFESKTKGIDYTVEIELDNVLPGIHQAIKYRVLRCAQRGLKLESNKVKTTVVAWLFNKEEEKLAKKYNIELIQKKLK